MTRPRKRGFGLLGAINCGKVDIYIGKLMEDRGYFNKVCLCGSSLCRLSVFMPIKLPGEGIYGRLHFSKVSAFNQIRGASRRPLSASVDSVIFSSP